MSTGAPTFWEGLGVTTTKQRWPITEALPVAEALRDTLAPACERIEIAGSIRRGREDVGDIELLCVPKIDGDALFNADMLDEFLVCLLFDGTLDYRLNKNGSRTYGPQNKLLRHVASGIPVDVFSTSLANWGMAMVVRTGPAEFNVRMMQRFLDLRMKGHAYGGVTSSSGAEIECPDGQTVFRLLMWPWQEPKDRPVARKPPKPPERAHGERVGR